MKTLGDGSVLLTENDQQSWSVRRCVPEGGLYRCISAFDVGLSETEEIIVIGETYDQKYIQGGSLGAESASSYSCTLRNSHPPEVTEEFEFETETGGAETILENTTPLDSPERLWPDDFIRRIVMDGDFGEMRDVVNCATLATAYKTHGRDAIAYRGNVREMFLIPR